MIIRCIRMMQKACKQYIKASGTRDHRFISCYSKLHVKIYQERENNYAYTLMQTKKYVNIIEKECVNTYITSDEFHAMIQQNWQIKTPAELFEAFSVLGNYSSNNGLCISNQIFDSFIDALTDNIKHASDKDLKSLFNGLSQWPETKSVKTRNFIEVWVALDDECNKRLLKWSHDENLEFVSHFYMLNVTKISDFTNKVLNRMASKAKQLTPSQLVQTMFFIGTMRRPPFDMHNLEIQVNSLFHEFSVEDLAIMSLGFFKSSTPIYSLELQLKIIDKMILDSKIIHEMCLAALLKIVRYSCKNIATNVIYNLLDTLQHEVSRLSIMGNVHMALVGASTLTLHKECLQHIAKVTVNSITEARLKDLERLVMTYGILHFIPDTEVNFFELVMNELRKPERISEIEKHTRSFASCVSYLGLVGIYPRDLMNKVLDPDFLSKWYKHTVGYGREVLVIHNCAKLFHSEAEMNRLSDKAAKILAKKYTDYVPSETFKKHYNFTEKMFIDIIKNLREDRGGEEYVIGEHILPHHQRGDIIVCNDRNGSPVKVHEHFSFSTFGQIREKPDKNIWVVLIVTGRNGIIHNTGSPTGPVLSKLKELKLLGYHVNLIIWSTYNALETKEKKVQYLNNLIKNAIAQGTKI